MLAKGLGISGAGLSGRSWLIAPMVDRQVYRPSTLCWCAFLGQMLMSCCGVATRRRAHVV